MLLLFDAFVVVVASVIIAVIVIFLCQWSDVVLFLSLSQLPFFSSKQSETLKAVSSTTNFLSVASRATMPASLFTNSVFVVPSYFA